MIKVQIAARIILGFIFTAAGMAGLLNLAPPPADLPENLKLFTDGLMATKYFFPLLKVTETMCGILLLSGQFVPLALIVLAPIVINIFLTHAFLQPSGLVVAVIIGLLEAYLAFFVSPYSESIRSLFRRK